MGVTTKVTTELGPDLYLLLEKYRMKLASKHGFVSKSSIFREALAAYLEERSENMRRAQAQAR